MKHQISTSFIQFINSYSYEHPGETLRYIDLAKKSGLNLTQLFNIEVRREVIDFMRYRAQYGYTGCAQNYSMYAVFTMKRGQANG